MDAQRSFSAPHHLQSHTSATQLPVASRSQRRRSACLRPHTPAANGQREAVQLDRYPLLPPLRGPQGDGPTSHDSRRHSLSSPPAQQLPPPSHPPPAQRRQPPNPPSLQPPALLQTVIPSAYPQLPLYLPSMYPTMPFAPIPPYLPSIPPYLQPYPPYGLPPVAITGPAMAYMPHTVTALDPSTQTAHRQHALPSITEIQPGRR